MTGPHGNDNLAGSTTNSTDLMTGVIRRFAERCTLPQAVAGIEHGTRLTLQPLPSPHRG